MTGPEAETPEIAVKGTFTLSEPVRRAPTRRSKRPKRAVETAGKRGFIAAARRFIAAAGRRAADGDEIELAELLSLRGDLDAAITVAVKGIKARGNSWAYIAQATGTTREAAYQKWGKK